MASERLTLTPFPLLAGNRFKIGQRVRARPTLKAARPRLVARCGGLGTVVGFSPYPTLLGVLPDGYRAPQRFNHCLWEHVDPAERRRLRGRPEIIGYRDPEVLGVGKKRRSAHA